MGRQQQSLPLCMVFLMAVLVVSALHAVPAEAARKRLHAGRALAQAATGTGYGSLTPGYTPSVPRGQPYSRGCTKIYHCKPPAAGGTP
ncbi:hypothetical protein QOZ80_2BG0171090 [Eleusine coracana subsp. coracana]|nr:hypothetical protein QOZ80_2BG0171090 [Eleusine coracana subsp. coracana]